MIKPSRLGYKTIKTGNRKHGETSPEQRSAARSWGIAHGYYGEVGGWIYNAVGQHIAHGWGEFYLRVGGGKINKWMEDQKMIKELKKRKECICRFFPYGSSIDCPIHGDP